MMKIFLNLVVLCTFHSCITSGQNPNATDDDKCSDVFKYLYISGLPVINNWKYEITSNGFVRCQSTYKYSSPQALELGCHSKIQSLLFTKLNIRTPTEDGEAVYSRNSDIFLNIAINAKQHNESTIYCQSLDRINYTTRSVIVELIYEPNKELPENRRRRLFLEKTISFAINTRADGDVCTIYTWLPIYSGPLMIEILGNYDHLDHFWCQSPNKEDEDKNPEVFLTKDDFSQYINPTEAITVIDTKYYANYLKWNCTLLTRKGGPIHRNNLYYYENATYSNINCITYPSVENEAKGSTLLFELTNGDTECANLVRTRNFTMKKDSTLTVKVFIQFYNKNLYTFWCERVDNDTKSNSIVLEANLTNVEDRTLSQFFAAATIPVPSLDGEFDCFLRGDAFPYNDTRRNMLIDPSDVNRPCHARVNFINTSFKHTSKPASTEVDASRWIYVGVGVGLVILCVGVAAIFLYRRKWRRNITVSGTQVN